MTHPRKNPTHVTMGNLTTSCLIIAILGVAIGLLYTSQMKQPFQIEVGDKTSGKTFEFLGTDVISNQDDSSIESNLLNIFEAKEETLATIEDLGKYGVAQLQGARPYQEDRILCMPNMSLASYGNMINTSISLFGVFDGHNGAEASEWASTKLQQRFLHHLRLEVIPDKQNQHIMPSNFQELNKKSATLSAFDQSPLAQNLKNALAEAIRDIESSFLEEARRKDLKSGTTASIVLQADNHILVANLGDSKTLLCPVAACSPSKPQLPKTSTRREQRLRKLRDRDPVLDVCGHGLPVRELSEDHHPDREDEKSRIELYGGFVENYGGLPRVNGLLAVSRSIGDVAFKRHGVTADPEWTGWMEIGENEGHLIIASDGIFEKLTTSEVCGIVCATISGVDISDPLGLSTQKSEAPIALQPQALMTTNSLSSRITQNNIDVQSSQLAPTKHEKISGQDILPRTDDKKQHGLCEDPTQTTPYHSEREQLEKTTTMTEVHPRSSSDQLHEGTKIQARVVARTIVETALVSGSLDNLSAVVVLHLA